jgi:hypothetical protein
MFVFGLSPPLISMFWPYNKMLRLSTLASAFSISQASNRVRFNDLPTGFTSLRFVVVPQSYPDYLSGPTTLHAVAGSKLCISSANKFWLVASSGPSNIQSSNLVAFLHSWLRTALQSSCPCFPARIGCVPQIYLRKAGLGGGFPRSSGVGRDGDCDVV